MMDSEHEKLISIGKLMLKINNGDLKIPVSINQISEHNSMNKSKIRDIFNLGEKFGYFKPHTTNMTFITEHGRNVIKERPIRRMTESELIDNAILKINIILEKHIELDLDAKSIKEILIQLKGAVSNLNNYCKELEDKK